MTATSRLQLPHPSARLVCIILLGLLVSGCMLPDVFSDPRESFASVDAVSGEPIGAEGQAQKLASVGEVDTTHVGTVQTSAQNRSVRSTGKAPDPGSEEFYDRTRKQQEANQRRWDAEARRAVKSVCDC
jgi:hypothetical protein